MTSGSEFIGVVSLRVVKVKSDQITHNLAKSTNGSYITLHI